MASDVKYEVMAINTQSWPPWGVFLENGEVGMFWNKKDAVEYAAWKNSEMKGKDNHEKEIHKR